MQSPRRTEKATVRKVQRRARSSPYARPSPRSDDSHAPPTPTGSFLKTLTESLMSPFRAWKTDDRVEVKQEEEDDAMTDERQIEDDILQTPPSGPPGGLYSTNDQDEDDSMQEEEDAYNEMASRAGPSNYRSPGRAAGSHANASGYSTRREARPLSRSAKGMGRISLMVPPTTEDSGQPQLPCSATVSSLDRPPFLSSSASEQNAALANFFAKKGDAPLTGAEKARVLEMLGERANEVESPNTSSSPAVRFHPGTPDHPASGSQANLSRPASRSTPTSTRRRVRPTYVGPGFSSRPQAPFVFPQTNTSVKRESTASSRESTTSPRVTAGSLISGGDRTPDITMDSFAPVSAPSGPNTRTSTPFHASALGRSTAGSSYTPSPLRQSTVFGQSSNTRPSPLQEATQPASSRSSMDASQGKKPVSKAANVLLDLLAEKDPPDPLKNLYESRSAPLEFPAPRQPPKTAMLAKVSSMIPPVKPSVSKATAAGSSTVLGAMAPTVGAKRGRPSTTVESVTDVRASPASASKPSAAIQFQPKKQKPSGGAIPSSAQVVELLSDDDDDEGEVPRPKAKKITKSSAPSTTRPSASTPKPTASSSAATPASASKSAIASSSGSSGIYRSSMTKALDVPKVPPAAPTVGMPSIDGPSWPDQTRGPKAPSSEATSTANPSIGSPSRSLNIPPTLPVLGQPSDKPPSLPTFGGGSPFTFSASAPRPFSSTFPSAPASANAFGVTPSNTTSFPPSATRDLERAPLGAATTDPVGFKTNTKDSNAATPSINPFVLPSSGTSGPRTTMDGFGAPSAASTSPFSFWQPVVPKSTEPDKSLSATTNLFAVTSNPVPATTTTNPFAGFKDFERQSGTPSGPGGTVTNFPHPLGSPAAAAPFPPSSTGSASGNAKASMSTSQLSDKNLDAFGFTSTSIMGAFPSVASGSPTSNAWGGPLNPGSTRGLESSSINTAGEATDTSPATPTNMFGGATSSTSSGTSDFDKFLGRTRQPKEGVPVAGQSPSEAPTPPTSAAPTEASKPAYDPMLDFNKFLTKTPKRSVEAQPAAQSDLSGVRSEPAVPSDPRDGKPTTSTLPDMQIGSPPDALKKSAPLYPFHEPERVDAVPLGLFAPLFPFGSSLGSQFKEFPASPSMFGPPATNSPPATSSAPSPAPAPAASVAFDWGAAGLAKPAAPAGTWTCGTCACSNPSSATEKCTICETPRS